MSDLLRGNAPYGSAASGRAQNGGTRPAQDAGPTPTDPPRYLTPTDIMRERRLREARRAEEAAARQRQQQESEARRRQDQEGIRQSTRRAESGRVESQPTQGYDIGGPAAPVAGPSRRQEGLSETSQAQPRPSSQQHRGTTSGHARISSNTQRNRTEAYDQLNLPATAQPSVQASTSNQPQQPTGPPVQQPRAGFPHAFERWETLSSHWEGLTSYWIRRLQENTNELDGKPIDQQMARQITDLSAAGANLFHAVVELQRLRASSERKFQRWFFETRNEQERAAEREAELERQLISEREARTVSSGSMDALRAEKIRAEELVREMRRELQISKEEARRAWEELGRREENERERTIALRNGEPTLIGGVQVVPMQGMSSRHGSAARPHTRDGSFGAGAGAPGPGVLGGTVPSQRPPSRQTTTTSLDSPGEEGRQFTYQPTGESPTSTDPFTETRANESPQLLRHEPDTQFFSSPPRPTQPPTSSAAMAAVQSTSSASRGPQQLPTTNGRFYQQSDPQTAIHSPPTGPIQQPQFQPMPPRVGTAHSEGRSYTGSSVGEEEYHINPDGSYARDSQGRRIPYREPLVEEHTSDEDDEDDYAASIERERMLAQQYARTSSATRSQERQQQQPQIPLVGQSGNIPFPRIPAATQQSVPPILSGSGGHTIHDEVTSTPPSSSQTQIQSQPQYQIQTQQPQSQVQGQSQMLPPPRPNRTDDTTTQQSTQQIGTALGGNNGNAAAGAGQWEGVTPRHRHPTRLSDIIEEAPPRASPNPSRGSYVSGGAGTAGGSAGAGIPPSTRV